MRVVFLGTPDFSVNALNSIYNSSHEIVGVVTQPDRKVGRKGIITPCQVKVQALNLNLPVFSFEKISTEGVETLKSLNADVFVTCAYGQILSQEILDIAPYGVINVHASLLPKYRGSSPIQWSIINGDKTTGVTIMKTALGVDTGDIILQEELSINGNYVDELFNRLSLLGASLIVKALDLIESGKATYIKQDDTKAVHVKMISKNDGLIDFSKSAIEIVNLVKGLYVWPTAFTYYEGKMLKVFKATQIEGKGNIGEVVVSDAKKGLVIGTSDGLVQVEEVQLEGGKKMLIKDFLLGKKITVGYRF